VNNDYKTNAMDLIQWLAVNNINLMVCEINEPILKDSGAGGFTSYYTIINKESSDKWSSYYQLKSWEQVYCYLQGYLQCSHESIGFDKK